MLGIDFMKMNDFLKSIAKDMEVNDRVFSSEDFYYMLKYVGIKKDIGLVEDIEAFYQEFLNSLNNSLVKYETRSQKYGENATHYISFYANKKADYLEAVKVYFPVKYEYMISALKTVFLYLIRNNIMASVKFHVKATNEGIVIRFYNKSDVYPFIHYCNNNFVLKDLLEPVHPFMATIYGLGVARDDNTIYSYNQILSEMLKEYFLLLKNNQSLVQASDLDFLDYLIKRANIEENEVVRFDIKAIEHNIKAILNMENPLD